MSAEFSFSLSWDAISNCVNFSKAENIWYTIDRFQLYETDRMWDGKTCIFKKKLLGSVLDETCISLFLSLKHTLFLSFGMRLWMHNSIFWNLRQVYKNESTIFSSYTLEFEGGIRYEDWYSWKILQEKRIYAVFVIMVCSKNFFFQISDNESEEAR